jgi:hypothetical protein
LPDILNAELGRHEQRAIVGDGGIQMVVGNVRPRDDNFNVFPFVWLVRVEMPTK